MKLSIAGAVLSLAARLGLPAEIASLASEIVAGLTGALILGISHRDVLPPPALKADGTPE